MLTPLDLVPEIQAANAPPMTTTTFNSTQTFDFAGKPRDSDSDTD